MQRGELADGLREAAELVGCNAQTPQCPELADRLREAPELVVLQAQSPQRGELANGLREAGNLFFSRLSVSSVVRWPKVSGGGC